MKKALILPLLFFCLLGLPSHTYALVPFGGWDIFRFPVTCELPAFLAIPNCPGGLPPPAYIEAPPLNFYDLFIQLYINSVVPLVGFLAVPIASPLLYPSYALTPGMRALGSLTPSPGLTGGIFIPGFTIYVPNGPPICIPSLCIPIAPAVGLVGPATGAAAGLF